MSLMQKALFLVALMAALWAAGARAQESCAPQDEGETLSDHRLLRQLSLDLRGRIPTIDEYQRLGAGEPVDTLLGEMLASDEYFAQVRRDHRALLWGSLGLVDNLASGGRRIGPVGSARLWRVGNNRRRYRGRNTLDCLNEPQPASAYDSTGRPEPLRTFSDSSCTGGTCRQEGYVMVSPYWAPDTEIKVCAYDAMTRTTGNDGNRCDVYNPDPGCGCGPNLRHCMPGATSAAQRAVREALEDEGPRIFEHVIREGRSYLEAFTTRETLVNGPSAFYYRNFSGAENVGSNARVHDPALGELPALSFQDDDEWRVITRSPEHSGVLTTLLFDLRFASNRSRANRFYTAFRCEPFVPPAGGLPAETSGDPDPNLRERDGCRSCHQTLEVAAAHFGRWRNDTTYGLLPTSAMDPMAVRDDCARCGDGGPRCSSFCNTYFVTADNSHADTVADWAGYPLARVYLNDSEAAAVDIGPAGLVDEPGEIDRVASCTARTVAERMLGRELHRDEHVGWVPDLTERFAASGYDYTALVRMLAESEVYRTVR